MEDFGQEICTIDHPFRIAVCWILLVTLPVLLCLSNFPTSKNYYLILTSLVLCLPAIYNLILSLVKKIQFFDNALVYKSLFGTKILPLDGNTQIYVTRKMLGSLLPMSYKIKVVNHKQQIVIEGAKSKLEKGIRHLERIQQKVIMPYLLEQLKNNQAIDFGRIQLTKDNITFRNKAFQWQQISTFILGKETLSLHSKNGSFFSNANNIIDLKQIANVEICLALLSNFSQVKKTII